MNIAGLELNVQKAPLPNLKKGELATDGENLYICFDNGEVEHFMRDEHVDEIVGGIIQLHEQLEH